MSQMKLPALVLATIICLVSTATYFCYSNTLIPSC